MCLGRQITCGLVDWKSLFQGKWSCSSDSSYQCHVPLRRQAPSMFRGCRFGTASAFGQAHRFPCVAVLESRIGKAKEARRHDTPVASLDLVDTSHLGAGALLEHFNRLACRMRRQQRWVCTLWHS